MLTISFFFGFALQLTSAETKDPHAVNVVDRAEEFGLAGDALDDKAPDLPESTNAQSDDHRESEKEETAPQVLSTERTAVTSESMPELNLDFEDFLPKPPEEMPVPPSAQETSLLDRALQNISSDLSLTDCADTHNPVQKDTAEEEASPQVDPCSEYDFNTVLRPSVSHSHVQVGENVFDVETRRPRWNVHGHASDANIKIGEYAPLAQLYQSRASPHGHSSDAHIKIGDYTSEVETSRPRWNVHGHVSAAHIQIGEYASEVEPSRPRWNIHGHASDANIKIGEYMSDVEPTRPRWTVHGHVSDANIRIGENVSEVVSSRPRWNIHGHSSQSHIKIGELIPDVEVSKPRWSPFGHASQSSIQIGEWAPSTEGDPIAHHKTTSGPASGSTVQTFLYGEDFCTTKGSDKSQEHQESALPQSESSGRVLTDDLDDQQKRSSGPSPEKGE